MHKSMCRPYPVESCFMQEKLSFFHILCVFFEISPYYPLAILATASSEAFQIFKFKTRSSHACVGSKLNDYLAPPRPLPPPQSLLASVGELHYLSRPISWGSPQTMPRSSAEAPRYQGTAGRSSQPCHLPSHLPSSLHCQSEDHSLEPQGYMCSRPRTQMPTRR